MKRSAEAYKETVSTRRARNGGQWHSPETIAKIKAATSAVANEPERILKIKTARARQVVTPAMLAALAANRHRAQSPEARAKARATIEAKKLLV